MLSFLPFFPFSLDLGQGFAFFPFSERFTSLAWALLLYIPRHPPLHFTTFVFIWRHEFKMLLIYVYRCVTQAHTHTRGKWQLLQLHISKLGFMLCSIWALQSHKRFFMHSHLVGAVSWYPATQPGAGAAAVRTLPNTIYDFEHVRT